MWKKVSGAVLTLFVPATAARTCCVQSRKCRVEFAIVVDGDDGDDGGTWWTNLGIGDSTALRYVRGEVVRPDSYDDDLRVECAHGIHVFATREEAEAFE